MGFARRYRDSITKILLGIWLFLAVDLVVFRSGLYFAWIDPGSSLGAMARAIDNAGHASRQGQNVLVIGDSRIAEGFSAKTATSVASAEGRATTFINLAIPGTTPRTWYYLLRAVLPTIPRPLAVVVMATSYHDNDSNGSDARLTDIAFAHPLLRAGDLASFPESFPAGSERFTAAEAILFSGFHYKNDFTEFISHPLARIETVRSARAHGFDWMNQYPGRDKSLNGTRLDLRTGELFMPPPAQSLRTAQFDGYVAALRQFGGRPPDDPSSISYRNTWYGRIATLCKSEGVAVFVLRIPRGPLHFLVDADAEPTGALAALQDGGRLRLLPAALFADLERPEFFFDQLHLNADGRTRFSTALARTMLQRLAGRE